MPSTREPPPRASVGLPPPLPSTAGIMALQHLAGVHAATDGVVRRGDHGGNAAVDLGGEQHDGLAGPWP